MSPPLVLASTSRYRRALLQRLQLSFRVVSPHVPETPLAGEHPRDLAARLATEKARDVAARFPQALVIGSDQVAALGQRILGKPGTAASARSQLLEMSGAAVDFFTAVTLCGDGGRVLDCATDHTRVRFRDLSPAAVDDYVAREQPIDCAGAFKCEGLGIALFRSISSEDPTALVGLPLIAVAGMLEAAGLPPLARA